MSIRDRVKNIGFIRRLIDDEVSINASAIREQLPALVEAEVQARITASALSFEEVGWRKLTGNPTRELPVTTQERMFEIGYWLWKTNPLGKFIIEIIVAFVVADGMPFTSDNDVVKNLLKDFWKDGANQLDLFFEKHVTELGVFGEICLPVYVLKNTGKVRLGYIDPADIESVQCDPHNVKIQIGVTLKSMDNEPRRKLAIVLGNEEIEILSPKGQALRDQFSDGLCFYEKINTLTNEPRGCSDLFVVADHLDGYEQFMADTMEKFAQFNPFYWDVTVEGMDHEELQKESDKFRPPKSGGAFVHNDKVKSEAVSPQQNAVDANIGARLLRNHIFGPFGIPEHWAGGGGDVNRATAAEMDLPALKMISRRQKTVKMILKKILDFVIRSALEARYLRIPAEEAVYQLQTPEINSKDVAKLATAVQSLALSLTAAQNNKWMDNATARKMFAFACSFVGFEYDPEKQDIPEAGYEDYAQGDKASGSVKNATGSPNDPQGVTTPGSETGSGP
jgi:hypothetical protein